MKLELKHLAPYLPYKTRGVRYSESAKGNLHTILDAGNIYSFMDAFPYKPILRPLSDLTKEIEVNGEKFVPIDEINIEGEPFVEYGVNGYGKEYLCFYYADGDDSIGFNYYEEFRSKLLSWHFDVFGLIPQGLAIDINTLP